MSAATETTAVVCGHVFRSERPVRVVIHHSDGVWQLVCGQHDHPTDCADFEPVGLEHIVERQSDLNDTASLQRGWLAELDETGVWNLSPFEE